jgi:hypothetical protein
MQKKKHYISTPQKQVEFGGEDSRYYSGEAE